jgi:hypothetical protein
MSHTLCLLILCCALALPCACTQFTGNNYFPLTDNARWDYTGLLSSADGHQRNFRGSFRVDGQTLIHGQRYYKLAVTADMSALPGAPKLPENIRYYRVASNGIYVLPGANINQPELLEMPLPIQTGVKWLSGTTEVQAERVGTIKAGGHTYSDCLKVTYRPTGGAPITENYLAPDVGLIKSVYVNNTAPKSVIEMTLETYRF